MTPETDAAVIASNGQWSFVLKETCQRLERERDEARARLEIITPSKNNPVAEFFSSNTPETDAETNYCDAMPDMPWVDAEVARKLERERDKAREDATNYYARIGELESERDELKKALEAAK